MKKIKFGKNLTKKQKLIFGIIAGILVIGLILLLVFWPKKNVEQSPLDSPSNDAPVQKPNIKIIDLESKSRPIAVMINNIVTARPYHSGLQDAYMVYEMIVEGGITRLMALYKDKNLD